MEEKEEQVRKSYYFTPLQVGYIANPIEPINIASDAKWTLDLKSGRPETEVIPIERHGAILGIVHKEDINKVGNFKESLVNRVLGKTAVPFMMPVHEVIEASSYINVVLERGLQNIRWDDPGWYVVEHKHKYYGVVNLRQMMEYSEAIQARDLKRAGEIQKNLLVQPELQDARFGFISYNRMANVVGGDWHKPLRINKDLYLFGCFDVAGKNISGALVTMSLGTCFATLEMVSYREGAQSLRKRDKPEQITSLINSLITKVNPPDVFVAGALLYVNFSTNMVEIHNCGLSPVTAFVPSDNMTIAYKTYKPNLPPLGLAGEFVPDPPQKIRISDGLRIVVFSDGLSDMSDIRGERYGDARTIQFLQNLHYIPADGFSTYVDREIDLWTKDTALADDVTLFELRFGNILPDVEQIPDNDSGGINGEG
ncbi:MAG: serine/threonine-protein phosphatase [Treponema sp.]|nr:serine/threonine-protein phosphatase [Treponema sp.]